jgi:AbrB family looped-hinge helix DNA binding protein
MRVAIDAVGRLVVPKPLRDELGISAATELELVARDGVLELSVADAAAHVEARGGTPVIALSEPAAPLTSEDVRAAIEHVRR